MADPDERGSDTTRLSTVADATPIIERFRRKDPSLSAAIPVTIDGQQVTVVNPPAPPSPWTSLTRLTVAAELLDIVNNPRRINQGPFNLCGPSAFWVIVAARHPKAFATAATDLFDTGRGSVGGLNIAPSTSLMSTDFPAIVARRAAANHSTATTQTEWMLISALQNSTPSIGPAWDGQPESGWSGIALPSNLESWFNSTGLFSSVKADTNVVVPGTRFVHNLTLGNGQDHVLLIDGAILEAPPKDWKEKIASLFGTANHWVLLTDHAEMDASSRTINLGIWTWGGTRPKSEARETFDIDLFTSNYYGAVSVKVG